ncbi:hypothetical protein LY78DRAFT_687076 [Colletotrichum sublineola]|nr:hypothetical protein LY78DRAFT_687076 [Colletotrichum sublineola]
MRFSVTISALMAVAVSAAPAPCNEYTCAKAPSGNPPDVGPGDLVGSFIP